MTARTKLNRLNTYANATELRFDASNANPGDVCLASRMRRATPASGDEEPASVCAQCRTGATESAIVGKSPSANQMISPRV
jgi:hypothetical protein